MCSPIFPRVKSNRVRVQVPLHKTSRLLSSIAFLVRTVISNYLSHASNTVGPSALHAYPHYSDANTFHPPFPLSLSFSLSHFHRIFAILRAASVYRIPDAIRHSFINPLTTNGVYIRPLTFCELSLRTDETNTREISANFRL